jgi:hypothetical protein
MYWPVSNNCGDLIGPYIARKIMAGRRVMYTEVSADYPYYVIGGSVLNHVNEHAIVWGAGLATITDGVNAKATIKAVRGPLTRARVLASGRPCPKVYGDPGQLLPSFYTPPPNKKHKIGIVPHYVDQYRAYDRYRTHNVIDVFQPIEAVIDEIASCERIYSSSLHGIIVAHAYGVPATWVKISDSLGGDGTKFRDYFMSVGMDVPGAIDLRDNHALPEAISDYVPNFDLTEYLKACPLPT